MGKEASTTATMAMRRQHREKDEKERLEKVAANSKKPHGQQLGSVQLELNLNNEPSLKLEDGEEEEESNSNLKDSNDVETMMMTKDDDLNHEFNQGQEFNQHLNHELTDVDATRRSSKRKRRTTWKDKDELNQEEIELELQLQQDDHVGHHHPKVNGNPKMGAKRRRKKGKQGDDQDEEVDEADDYNEQQAEISGKPVGHSDGHVVLEEERDNFHHNKPNISNSNSNKRKDSGGNLEIGGGKRGAKNQEVDYYLQLQQHQEHQLTNGHYLKKGEKQGVSSGNLTFVNNFSPPNLSSSSSSPQHMIPLPPHCAPFNPPNNTTTTTTNNNNNNNMPPNIPYFPLNYNLNLIDEQNLKKIQHDLEGNFEKKEKKQGEKEVKLEPVSMENKGHDDVSVILQQHASQNMNESRDLDLSEEESEGDSQSDESEEDEDDEGAGSGGTGFEFAVDGFNALVDAASLSVPASLPFQTGNRTPHKMKSTSKGRISAKTPEYSKIVDVMRQFIVRNDLKLDHETYEFLDNSWIFVTMPATILRNMRHVIHLRNKLNGHLFVVCYTARLNRVKRMHGKLKKILGPLGYKQHKLITNVPGLEDFFNYVPDWVNTKAYRESFASLFGVFLKKPDQGGPAEIVKLANSDKLIHTNEAAKDSEFISFQPWHAEKPKKAFDMLLRFFEIVNFAKEIGMKCPEPMCPFFSTNKDDLIDHINGEHIKFLAFKCYTCPEEFYTKKDMRDHKTVHPENAKKKKRIGESEDEDGKNTPTPTPSSAIHLPTLLQQHVLNRTSNSPPKSSTATSNQGNSPPSFPKTAGLFQLNHGNVQFQGKNSNSSTNPKHTNQDSAQPQKSTSSKVPPKEKKSQPANKNSPPTPTPSLQIEGDHVISTQPPSNSGNILGMPINPGVMTPNMLPPGVMPVSGANYYGNYHYPGSGYYLGGYEHYYHWRQVERPLMGPITIELPSDNVPFLILRTPSGEIQLNISSNNQIIVSRKGRSDESTTEKERPTKKDTEENSKEGEKIEKIDKEKTSGEKGEPYLPPYGMMPFPGYYPYPGNPEINPYYYPNYNFINNNPNNNNSNNNGNSAHSAFSNFEGAQADFAEYMPFYERVSIKPGDVVLLNEGKISTLGFDKDRVIPRIISTNPLILGNSPKSLESMHQNNNKHAIIAMMGQVPVNLRNDVIANPGDFIVAGNSFGDVYTLSPEEMSLKWELFGRIVGIALEHSCFHGSQINQVPALIFYTDISVIVSALNKEIVRGQSMFKEVERRVKRLEEENGLILKRIRYLESLVV